MAYESNRKRIYLDYAAATPVSEAARAAMAQVAGVLGNPSSIHEEGRVARTLLDAARDDIAQVIGAAPTEILFTASGSEADALAVLGTARAYKDHGRHIIVSAIEHKAILKSAQLLQGEGFDVTYLAPDSDGLVSPQSLAAAVRPDTILVSIMYANNEVGTVEPIAALSDVVRQARGGFKEVPLFHTDAAQAPGALPLLVEELGIDLMSLNSAKAYGPKGVGALYIRSGIRLMPLTPGEQQGGLRGGTENVELIVGFAAALKESEALRKHESARLAALRDCCFSEITKRFPDALINGSRTHRLPNNVHVSFPYIEGESILLMLDAAGIACATGSACNSFDLAPSHVLLALGAEAALAHGSVRLTFGRDTIQNDVSYVIEVLSNTVTLLRSMSAITPHTYERQ